MNKLSISKNKSIFPVYENEFYDIKVDGIFINELLHQMYPKYKVNELVPTLNGWMIDAKEEKIVLDRILPSENQKQLVPILMCPDDCDFSCTVVIAEIERNSDGINWNKIGIDRTEMKNNHDRIGENVEWFNNFIGFKFELNEYIECIELLKKSIVS